MGIISSNLKNKATDVEDTRLDELLRGINSENRDYLTKTEKELEERKIQNENEERLALERKKKERYLSQYEREQEAIQKREQAIEQEQAELRDRRNKSVFGRLMNQAEDHDRGIVEQIFCNSIDRSKDLYAAAREKQQKAKEKKAVLMEKKKAEKAELEKQKAIEAARKKEEEEKARLQREQEQALAKEENAKEKEQKAKAKRERKSKKAEEPSVSVESESLKEENRKLREELERMKSNPPQKEEQPAPKQETKKLSNEEYDSLLSKETTMLKRIIQKNHDCPDPEAIDRTITEISQKANVKAILVSTADFNNLFVFTDKEMFLRTMMEVQDGLVDFSYIYVITPTATMYYGIDECYQNVTNLFDNIRDVILRSRRINEKDILAIENINIFRNIWIG